LGANQNGSARKGFHMKTISFLAALFQRTFMLFSQQWVTTDAIALMKRTMMWITAGTLLCLSFSSAAFATRMGFCDDGSGSQLSPEACFAKWVDVTRSESKETDVALIKYLLELSLDLENPDLDPTTRAADMHNIDITEQFIVANLEQENARIE